MFDPLSGWQLVFSFPAPLRHVRPRLLELVSSETLPPRLPGKTRVALVAGAGELGSGESEERAWAQRSELSRLLFLLHFGPCLWEQGWGQAVPHSAKLCEPV